MEKHEWIERMQQESPSALFKGEKEFYAALCALDWEGMAEAWQKADKKWHSQEWRLFITGIQEEERKRLYNKIAKEYLFSPHSPPPGFVSPYTRCDDCGCSISTDHTHNGSITHILGLLSSNPL